MPPEETNTPDVADLTDAQIAAKRERLRLDLHLSSLDHTFANFQHVPGTETAYTAFLSLATRDDCRPLLLCYGGVGNGKTYLCEALAIEWYRRGMFTRIQVWPRLTNVLRSAARGEFPWPLDYLVSGFQTAKRLILDDVGMGGSGSAWEWGQLEEIICARYQSRLPTVLCTNLDLRELPERVVSRFADPELGVIVLNIAPDHRRREKKGTDN